ncbi:alpha-1,6-mannosyl-glycoprotein 2-beta-N-acetylglucosaminyltransferase-like [Ptychodera flava]|uniref:alpha-1,6-mannosyl-glycoprotein 2-beta-N-acetylglucosaminyltransferase-like n=1 Tax=Ptychodera flava TaxID=63121 RepID=UPI00396A1E24
MRPFRVFKLLLFLLCVITVSLYILVSNEEANHRSRRPQGHPVYDGKHVVELPAFQNPIPEQQKPEPIDLAQGKRFPRTEMPNLAKSNASSIKQGKPQSNDTVLIAGNGNVKSEKWTRPKVDLNNIAEIKAAMLDVNHKQYIHNLDKFPSRPSNSIVVVVQAHQRHEYLQFLINSMRAVPNIEEILLVISLDWYSEEMNAIVDSIDFCQVIQIFYPFSIQVYKDEFPGFHPNDCPRDMPKAKAADVKCNNWEHPDQYGHYREPRYTMTKHHWWWKLQHVFTGLDTTADHNGLVLLLEEDHYVIPDFLSMLSSMYNFKKNTCPECDILTLGLYDKGVHYSDRSNKVDALIWHSSKHNMGMAMDRNSFNKLQGCAKEFCVFDDYNWDWTLQHISKHCMSSSLMALVSKSPRVFHIGECGIHHNGKQCNVAEKVKHIESVLEVNKQHLFPNELKLGQKTRTLSAKPSKPNGGWGDIRDHALCMSYGKKV